MLTHYDILDIANDASPEDIRRAYRVMSKKHHPDRTGGVNSRLYSAVNEAFAVLSNPEKRAEYDRVIQDPDSSSSSSSAPEEEFTPSSPDSSHDYAGIRQVSVSWSKLSWWRDPVDGEVPIRNLVPYRFTRLAIVSAYWIALFLLAAVSFLSPVDQPWGEVGKLVLGGLGATSAFLLQRDAFRNGFSFKFNALHALWLSLTIWWASAAGSAGVWWIIILSGVVMGLGVLSGRYSDKYIDDYVPMLPKPFLDRKALTEYSSWGKVGDLDDAIEKFGAENVAKGVAGEQYTAALFWEIIARIPGVKVFHGLKFPDSDKADVDHVIVLGNRVIFVDSKQWSAGEYSWSDTYGMINQVGRDVSYTRQTHFNDAVEKYRLRLPSRVQVSALMLIHGVGVKVSDTNHTQGHVRMAGTQDGMEILGNALASVENPYVDFRVMNFFANNTKA